MKLNSIILADDSDSDLFVMLKDATLLLLDDFACTQTNIEVASNAYMSDAVSKHTLSEKLSVVNNDSFLCFWYGHGKYDCFKIGDEQIVTTTENHYIFTNAMIYTFSCLNGGELADTLISNYTKAFVGYSDSAYCPCGIDDVTCRVAMTFLSSLLGGKSIIDSVEDLKSAYEDTMFEDGLDPFQAESFQRNRDNIVLKGNGTLTIKDFIIG